MCSLRSVLPEETACRWSAPPSTSSTVSLRGLVFVCRCVCAALLSDVSEDGVRDVQSLVLHQHDVEGSDVRLFSLVHLRDTDTSVSSCERPLHCVCVRLCKPGHVPTWSLRNPMVRMLHCSDTPSAIVRSPRESPSSSTLPRPCGCPSAAAACTRAPSLLLKVWMSWPLKARRTP